jgi:hypothetical protein
MSDTANAPIDLANNSELIADLARFSEGVLTESQIRRKWRHLDNNVWEAPDDALVDAVEAERVRRVRSGRAAREKAQNLAAQAPDTQRPARHLSCAGRGLFSRARISMSLQRRRPVDRRKEWPERRRSPDALARMAVTA